MRLLPSLLPSLSLCLALLMSGESVRAQTPDTVYFPSADGRTELVAYRASPARLPAPAIVLLHGRGGPYTGPVAAQCKTVARGQDSPCGADSLSARHRQWLAHWAEQGYTALLVDSFGPRGRAHGYGRNTHGIPEREAVNERTVRPLDAEGALRWLAAQPEVQAGRILVQGWSNGGSTVLNVLQRQSERAASAEAGAPRFAAALAFYPGCGERALLSLWPQWDVPVLMLLAGADEEVSPRQCEALVARAQARVPPQLRTYAGAAHGFDSPVASLQREPDNAAAREDALRRATAFVRAQLP